MSEFTFCLNTSTIRPVPLLRKIAIAGRAGFRAIEPWNDEVTEYLDSGGTIHDLNRATGDAGLSVVSVIALHSWATTDGAEYHSVLEDCKRRMHQAAALGSPYIVASPPQEVVDLGRASDRFGELFRLGRAAGVEPAMEFLGFVDGINTVAAAWTVASNGAEGSSIVADVFHMIRGGGSIDDLLTVPGDRLAVFHMNDLPARPDPRVQTDADRVMLGDGIADLKRVVSHLRTIGYRGPLSLELFNPALWAKDPEEVVKLGIERLRRIVDSAGTD